MSDKSTGSGEPGADMSTRPRMLKVMKDHIRQYLETDGEEGHIFEDLPCLLLTTRGRGTGHPRQVALIYGRHREDYVVIASMGGADVHPSWYRNLLADPVAQIQVIAEVIRVRARTADAKERAAIWVQMAEIFPNYNDYQSATSREIPVVILESMSPNDDS